MEELIKKLEAYNIFNFLLPGIIYVYAMKYYIHINMIFDDIVQMSFVYYFIGLVISRIGSLIIEPMLKKIEFVKFAHYSEYIKASNIDKKIENFSMDNNMFRTFISLFSSILFIKMVYCIIRNIDMIYKFVPTVIILLFIILFLFAYRKQTNYIKKRVESYINKDK